MKPAPVNAAPLIKLKKAPRQVAPRILGALEVRKLIELRFGPVSELN